MKANRSLSIVLGAMLALTACGDDASPPQGVSSPDLGGSPDAGMPGDADATTADFGALDAGDGAVSDVPEMDLGAVDLGSTDGGALDAGPSDGGPVFPDVGPPPTGIGVWDWSPTAPGPARLELAGDDLAWTGTHMIMSGGRGSPGFCATSVFSYNPFTDAWRNLRLEDDFARSVYVNTGRELIDFGGLYCGSIPRSEGSFAVIYPRSSLRVRPPMPSGGGASKATAAWTGTELLVFPIQCLDTASCMDGPARFDPIAGTWRPISTAGLPPKPETDIVDVPFLWTGREAILWGGAAASGRYDPTLDLWSPLPSPVFNLQAGVGVWTGDKVFIWDGQTGALFDPMTDVWTQTSSVGAPLGIAFERSGAAWTGEEVILLDDTGGGRYNPVTDVWTVLDPHATHYPSSVDSMLWTGRELLVVAPGTPTRAWKYGPKVTGQASCTGQDGSLSVRIDTPSTRTVASTVRFEASVSGGPVQSVAWSLDGATLPTTELSGSVDLGASVGPRNLRVEASDFNGQTACHEVTLLGDAPPTLSVLGPVDGFATSDGLVRVQATCADGGGTCYVRLAASNGSRASSVGPNFDQTLDLSGEDGTVVTLTLTAVDAVGQEVSAQREVYVEMGSVLSRVADAIPGEVCDVNATSILSADAQLFYVLDRTSGMSTPINTNLTPNCAESRLVGPREVVLHSVFQVAVWSNGSFRTSWSSLSTKVAPPWVATYRGNDVTLYDAASGTTQTINGAGRILGADVGPNGRVFWIEEPATLKAKSANGSVETLASSLPGVGGISYLVATSSEALWRRGSGGSWGLDIWTGSRVETRVTPSTMTTFMGGGPRSGVDYDRAGNLLSFEGDDAIGTFLLWVRENGMDRPVPMSTEANFRGLTGSGDVSFEANGRLKHAAAGSTAPADVGSTSGRIVATQAFTYVQYGSSLFEIRP